MEGFAGRHKEDEFQGRPILKLLLRAAMMKKGRPDFSAEAVLLHFASPHWDLKVNECIEKWCTLLYTCTCTCVCIYIHVHINERYRRKKERSKQGQTNNKAKQQVLLCCADKLHVLYIHKLR